MNDEELDSELGYLEWMESQFNDGEWLPKESVPTALREAIEQRQGRFYGEEFTYYLSKKGNVTRYAKT